MEPKKTLWKLDQHTRGKHEVLRNYLNAWLPILGRNNQRILIIDGFAGPGIYENKEDGSPIIALKALAEHRSRNQITSEVVFIFIEKEIKRAEYLKNVIDNSNLCLPTNCKIEVKNGVFDETMTQILDQLDSQTRHLAPCFVMVDPFGVSETPMSIMHRILQNPKSEVYISFMYEAINRFKCTPEFEKHLDNLFGSSEWRNGINITDVEARKDFFYNLYENQLRLAGAKYVVHFDLYEGQRLIYAIFFGTQSPTGCDRMKQSIWKVAPFGDFTFHAAHLGQLTLGLQLTDYSLLKQSLQKCFSGKGWISIEEVVDFTASDKTDFHTGHLKRNALTQMEDEGLIEVDGKTRKKKRTYPDRTRLRFF